MTYTTQQKVQACAMRQEGCSYHEITKSLGIRVPNSTLSYWFRDIILPSSYYEQQKKENVSNLKLARTKAVRVNRSNREQFFTDLAYVCKPIANQINEINTAKIALAMLCLGEASKYSQTTRRFNFGNSNPVIITLFMSLMSKCFEIDPKKYRATVQMRADQSASELEKFWQKITKIPASQFYKSRIDPRTIGKPTKKSDYKGVLRIDYFNVKIQHELEMLARLCSQEFSSEGL